jgi:hypothetical protein
MHCVAARYRGPNSLALHLRASANHINSTSATTGDDKEGNVASTTHLATGLRWVLPRAPS